MIRARRFTTSVALAVVLATTATSFAAAPPLIPRTILFGNPERASLRLSSDGRQLAWLAPDPKNVMQVWVRTIGKNDDRMVTADRKRGIRTYSWAYDDKTLIYVQDNDGDENYHVFGADLQSGMVRDLTPIQGVRANVIGGERSMPDQFLVALNARDKKLFDVYRVTISTGALTLDTKNPGDVAAWIADGKLQVRMAQFSTPSGGTEVRYRATPDGEWKTWLTASAEDEIEVIGFAKDGKSVYLKTSIGSDTTRVVQRNIASGSETLIAQSPEVDAGPVILDPATRVVQAVGFAPGRNVWKVVDPAIKPDFAAIAKLDDGDFSLVGRDRSDKTWLLAFNSDRGPTKYYSWDRATKKGTFLVSTQPKLENLQLSAMQPVTITTRDGLSMHSYLTLPAGVEPKNLPMVLFVHGGPWGRDEWGYSRYPQWLANRGYVVLQPNFRSSTGYGKKFLHAGDRQWGLKMHDDLIDAVTWAVASGYADPKRVAIMGGSYGGYATLAGLAFTPDIFAAGVDIVGPSNLATLLRSIPPYWKAQRAMFDQRMGNIDDPKDAELMRNASPLFRADQIRRPLLIGQGLNDPRVNHAESEQVVDAITKNKGSVTYVLYSDEGHGFGRPENSIDFSARAEAFLARYLGGRAEPLSGDPYPGSTAKVKVVTNGEVAAK